MPLKNGNEEQALSKALRDVRIINSTIEEIKSAIRYCMLKVGLRAANLPNDEEKAILIQHLVTEYGNHTSAEIRLAFDMAISGKLDLERKEIVCYENFSCLYFSGIMNAYRRWSAQAYRHSVKDEPYKQREYTKEELKQIDFDYGMGLRMMLHKRLLPPLK